MADPHTRLVGLLAEELGSPTAERLVAQLTALPDRSDAVSAVLSLLTELAGVSEKAARAAIEALPMLEQRAGLTQVVPWLDIGAALAETSGATALKYLKDSPLILGVIRESEARAAVLAVTLELAELDANVAMEYLRTAPQILDAVPFHQLKPWLEIGVELAQADVVVGLEYIRQIPVLAAVLPVENVRSWLSWGMKLIAPNTLGKPDYLATMEFLRTSPAILGEIEEAPVRAEVVALGVLLADRSPESGIAWLGESPRLLRSLPSMDWRMKVLRYGLLLGERDAEATLRYLRRCPEIVSLIGEGAEAPTRFENWFKTGMEVLSYSPEGARAYFAVESQKALASVEEALSGVSLRQVARRVKLFVEGLCGNDVTIMALPDSATDPAVRATVSPDGRTIALPAILRRYPTAEENERLYLILAAHEAGHLQFGTYRLALESLADLVRAVQARYGRSVASMPDTLAAFFRLYPHPRLIQDLWTVLEDARVEHLLQEEYPGLRRDLARLACEAIPPRDPAHGVTVKELIVDCLLRLSSGEPESSAVPHALQREVSMLWSMCRPLLTLSATAEQTVRVAHDIYLRMEELLAPRGEMIEPDRTGQELEDLGVGPTSSESEDAYRPVTNWGYRGAMHPEFITWDQNQTVEQRDDLEHIASRAGSSKEGGSLRGSGGQERKSEAVDELGGRSLPPIVDELLALELEDRCVQASGGPAERAVRYPEWDCRIRDYRMNWCRVIGRPAESGSDEDVSSTLTAHRSTINTLRRFFESLRPPAFRRVPGQADGEDLDVDALVRWAADQNAGFEGGDRMYIRREKKERHVAVAFLVDVSGSTSRQIESGRRVIDVEKDSLALLCEALEAVGDQYGLYAYSGQGRASVDFMTIKDFDERLGPTTARRLGGLGPRQQNRDGAAIRHAAAKLMAREAKTRLLILVSDGRPLDDDYKDEYSLEDTKAALREARQKGIEAFCVTIDRDADRYLRRMYGDVRYAVIDRVEALPAKLPRIYQKLTT